MFRPCFPLAWKQQRRVLANQKCTKERSKMVCCRCTIRVTPKQQHRFRAKVSTTQCSVSYGDQATLLPVYPDVIFAIYPQEMLWSACWSRTLGRRSWINHSSGLGFWHSPFFAGCLAPLLLPALTILFKRLGIGGRKARTKRVLDVLTLFSLSCELNHVYWRQISEIERKLFLGCGCSTIVFFCVCYSFII